MNAVATFAPLRQTASRTPSRERPARRRRIGDHLPDPVALEDFNRLLARLQAPPVEPDQLASLARRLAPQTSGGAAPAWIAGRMRNAAAINLMLSDAAWEPDERCVEAACLVMGYLRRSDDLIPDQLPRLGRLDDALVVEAAWPQLAGEIGQYLDYCRLRRIEAALRGCGESGFAFDRNDWRQARLAERAWTARCREIGLRSYLPAVSPCRFRIC